MIQEITRFIGLYPTLSIAWISLGVTLMILTYRILFSKIESITCTKAIELINKEEGIVIDLRCNDDFRKGHIIDSINLTPLEIKNNNIQLLEKHKKKPIIMVSENGMRAQKPAVQLTQYGFERVFILKEGINSWTGSNLPLVFSKK